MLELREYRAPLLTHLVVPAGPIPPVFDPDGVYPYGTYVETSRRPVLREYAFVTLENNHLRVTICPDLGGKVHSLYDKRARREVLFVPRSIHPVRILPRFGFIPGGIEASFPVSHSPVQLERVACQTEVYRQRAYCWCGERELRFGLHWTVEWSLGAGERHLTQRMRFLNPTSKPHPWMSWSNAAVPARPDTEFHFPSGPVLAHGHDLAKLDWRKAGPRRVSDLSRMAGFFWLAPDVCAFGAYTPSLGCGLYHVADPDSAPGIKLWSYGLGRHEPWGQAASLGGDTYVELQGGPLRDQSIRQPLGPGEQRQHTEFWLPSRQPLNVRALRVPPVAALLPEHVPLFSWPPRPSLGVWTQVMTAHCVRGIDTLPPPPGWEENCWAPSGMDGLGKALDWAAEVAGGDAGDAWRFQLGAWQAARGRVQRSLATLARSGDDRARALEARIRLRARQEPDAAIAALARIQSEALALHPQVMIERDLALAALGSQTLPAREAWLARLAHCADEWVLERRAAWLADAGRFAEAKLLLERTPFQLVHQRYERTRLWRRIQRGLGLPPEPPPPSLGEDDLAVFGAYRAFEDPKEDPAP